MATAADFPNAVRIEPVYLIDGKYYRLVPLSDGQKDPTAIRAKFALENGEAKIKWFVPAGFISTPEANSEDEQE